MTSRPPAPPPLPAFGFASDLAASLPAVDPADPNRLVAFVKAVAPSAREAAPAPEKTVHLIAFRLGDELYAAPVERVVEIVRVQNLTRVPQAPEHVRGVQNLRGAILPVLEVKTRLGLPPVAVTHDSRIMAVEAHGRLVGLIVDAVVQVVRVPQSTVQPPPPEVRSRCSEHVVGIARLGDRMALLLDLDKLLLLPTSSSTEGNDR